MILLVKLMSYPTKKSNSLMKTTNYVVWAFRRPKLEMNQAKSLHNNFLQKLVLYPFKSKDSQNPRREKPNIDDKIKK